MNPKQKININLKFELRMQNTIFKCGLDGKYYNKDITNFYVVSTVHDVLMKEDMTPHVIFGCLMVCETCWELNKEPKGLCFKEPTGIVLPSNQDVNKFRKGGGN